MESAVCYICCDRRRTADTDTSYSKIGIRNDSETLKEVLLRALSVGFVEDNPSEVETSRTSYGVCVISLNSQCDGHLQALCNKVADEAVIICKRCEKLLKDFEYHERTSAQIAKEIQSYLSRQSETQEEGVSEPTPISSTPVITHKLDEKQSIQAAFKALRRSGLASAKKRGRKRKSVETQPTDSGSVVKDESDVEHETFTESDVQEHDTVIASSRMSKRIQRRREEGLVVRWGDAGYDEEIFTEGNVDSGEDIESLDEDAIRQDMQSRKRKGRRPNRLKFSKPVDSPIVQTSSDLSSLKYQCPFCQRYYVPSNSRVHNCTSYKNQLRCHVCNIFFTSYIRLEKHLEVIHLRQRQLQCPEENCKFTCISEPAFLLHKHFHFLSKRENDGLTLLSGSITESGAEQLGNPQVEEASVGHVTVIDDDQGVVTSPDMAEQVSFLLDEKSFLADGRPINIMTDSRKFPGEIRESSKKFQILSRKTNESQAKISSAGQIKQSDGPSQNKISSLQSLTVTSSQCPFCDLVLDGSKSVDNHVRDVHRLVVRSKFKDTNILGANDRSKDILLKKNFNLIPQIQTDMREEQAAVRKVEN